ncbi:MAG: glutamate racemase [Fibrobacterota bacterium]
MSDSRPIAVFDSGLGGLSVVTEIMQLLPQENIIYFGDTLRCPYGGRSSEAVRLFTREIVSYILSKDVKMIVAACNTVSSLSLDLVEAMADPIPVLGVIEPGARAGLAFSSHKKIGVIGTRGTVESHAYKNKIAEIDSSVTVYEKACPLFVPFVEENILHGVVVERLIDEYLDGLVDSGIDTIVLGCTHYPLLKDTIHSVLGGTVSIIDSAWWTAQEVKKRLDAGNLKHTGVKIGKYDFYVTDVTRNLTEVSRAFLGKEIEPVLIDLQVELERIK